MVYDGISSCSIYIIVNDIVALIIHVFILCNLPQQLINIVLHVLFFVSMFNSLTATNDIITRFKGYRGDHHAWFQKLAPASLGFSVVIDDRQQHYEHYKYSQECKEYDYDAYVRTRYSYRYTGNYRVPEFKIYHVKGNKVYLVNKYDGCYSEQIDQDEHIHFFDGINKNKCGIAVVSHQNKESKRDKKSHIFMFFVGMDDRWWHTKLSGYRCKTVCIDRWENKAYAIMNEYHNDANQKTQVCWLYQYHLQPKHLFGYRLVQNRILLDQAFEHTIKIHLLNDRLIALNGGKLVQGILNSDRISWTNFFIFRDMHQSIIAFGISKKGLACVLDCEGKLYYLFNGEAYLIADVRTVLFEQGKGYSSNELHKQLKYLINAKLNLIVSHDSVAIEGKNAHGSRHILCTIALPTEVIDRFSGERTLNDARRLNRYKKYKQRMYFWLYNTGQAVLEPVCRLTMISLLFSSIVGILGLVSYGMYRLIA